MSRPVHDGFSIEHLQHALVHPPSWLVDTRLEEYLHLQDAQIGFRSGLSTEFQIIALKHIVQ